MNNTLFCSVPLDLVRFSSRPSGKVGKTQPRRRHELKVLKKRMSSCDCSHRMCAFTRRSVVKREVELGRAAFESKGFASQALLYFLRLLRVLLRQTREEINDVREKTNENKTAHMPMFYCPACSAGSIPPQLGNLHALKKLVLYSNRLSGETPRPTYYGRI